MLSTLTLPPTIPHVESELTARKRAARILFRNLSVIEVIFVFMIFSLLVIAVLKGQQLIESTRVKLAVRDLNAVAAAVLSYRGRYGATPGDDGPLPALNARGFKWAAVNAGDADGTLEVALAATFSGTAEGGAFWQQLRSSGFLNGDPVAAYIDALPENAWGGLLGITSADMGGGLTGIKACYSQMPGATAFAIDRQLDDGVGSMGAVRATVGTSGTDTNPANVQLAQPYSDEAVYTLCFRL